MRSGGRDGKPLRSERAVIGKQMFPACYELDWRKLDV